MDAIWTFLRLCGIVVGVATLLRLATFGFGVEYKEFFQQFMDSIAGIVELGFLIDPLEKLVHGVLDWLRGMNLPIPDLHPHWRPVFTLMWLLMAAFARNFPGNFALRNVPWKVPAQLVWAFVCCLVAAVGAGTQQTTSYTVMTWPLLGFVIFYAILVMPGSDDGDPPPGPRFVRLAIPLFGSVLFVATMVPAVVSRFSWHSFEPFFSPLLWLVGIVALLGLLYAANGLRAATTWRKRLEDPATATGLDICGVIGGALAIGYVMMK